MVWPRGKIITILAFVLLVPISLLIISSISYFINQTQSLAIAYTFTFWSSSENARYILSALSQAQAAIFAIFFTLNFIIIQLQIQNKAASPKLMKHWFRSPNLIFIFLVYAISITGDLILLRYATDGVNVNLFWALFLSLLAFLILIPFMYFNVLTLFGIALKEEILAGQARNDLSGIDLSGDEFVGVDLSDKNLNEANLNGTLLIGANLAQARLNEANLAGADLMLANLKGTSVASILKCHKV